MSETTAELEKKTAKTAPKAAENGNGRTRVRWDDSQMKSSYANVCNVTSTREEVTMLFGTNQTWNNARTELTVQLTDRVIINPYAAKRLSMLLAGVVQEYEKRFGELKIDASQANGADTPAKG